MDENEVLRDFNMDFDFDTSLDSNPLTMDVGAELVENSDFENENKRLRINRTKHRRVHSDPNVFTAFLEQNEESMNGIMDDKPLGDLQAILGSEEQVPLPIINVTTRKPPLGYNLKNEPSENRNGIASPCISSSSATPPTCVPSSVLGPGNEMLELSLDPISYTNTNENPNRSLEDIDEFLKLFPYPTEALPAEPGVFEPLQFHSTKVKQHTDSIKEKRKRSHQRHHSNPIDLLHNLDQIRQIAANSNDNGMDFSYGETFVPSTPPMYAAGNSTPSTPIYNNPPSTPVYNSSPSTPMYTGSPAPNGEFANSTYGSLDAGFSNLDIGYQSPSVQGFGTMQSPFSGTSPPSFSLGSVDKNYKLQKSKSNAEDGPRKQYKCGRCGKPKVGHVCTMPDQRNNATQVDVQITRGLKRPDMNAKVIFVKNKHWSATHRN